MNNKQLMLKTIKSQNINLITLIRLLRAHDTKELAISIANNAETIFLSGITSLN